MIGTIQANCTGGAPMTVSVKGDQAIKKKTYEYKMLWQHNTQPLVTAVWSDNNFVKILSNYHQPQIIHAGMTRRKIGEEDDIREKYQSPVNALMKNVDYFNTYNQIDNKSNQIEAR